MKLQEDARVLTRKVDGYLARAMDGFFAEQGRNNRSREIRADLRRDHARRIGALEGKSP